MESILIWSKNSAWSFKREFIYGVDLIGLLGVEWDKFKVGLSVIDDIFEYFGSFCLSWP